LVATTRCSVAELVETFGRRLMLSTSKGVSVKQIAERHPVGDLGVAYAVAGLVRMFKAEPWVRASRIRRMSF
jgi:hypothetical protein